MDTVQQIKTKNYIVTVSVDTDPDNPRETDYNLGTMTCLHRRYSIGDRHNHDRDTLDAHIDRADVVSLPVYAYIHSGITINTTGFSCTWDSGKLGYIHATHDDIKRYYNADTLTPDIINAARERLADEVNEYDDYMNGTFYMLCIERKEYNADANEIETEIIETIGGYRSIEDALLDAAIYVDDETATTILQGFLQATDQTPAPAPQPVQPAHN